MNEGLFGTGALPALATSVSPPPLVGPCVCAARLASARPVYNRSPSCYCVSQAQGFGSLAGVWRLAPLLAFAPFLEKEVVLFTRMLQQLTVHKVACGDGRSEQRRRRMLGGGSDLPFVDSDFAPSMVTLILLLSASRPLVVL